MALLLKNGKIVNVFTGEIEEANVLIKNKKIVGVGDYLDDEADEVVDSAGKYIAQGITDDHECSGFEEAFVSLSVIPSLKMTTRGLIDVNKFELIPLFVD